MAKHVGSAVPAVFALVKKPNQIFEAVKTSGLKYMLLRPSNVRSNLYAIASDITRVRGLGNDL